MSNIKKDIETLYIMCEMLHEIENTIYGNGLLENSKGFDGLAIATEHVLKELERLQKENKELKEKYKFLYEGKIEHKKAGELLINSQFISKTKIKEKIKELEEKDKRKELCSEGFSYCGIYELEKLLESEE